MRSKRWQVTVKDMIVLKSAIQKLFKSVLHRLAVMFLVMILFARVKNLLKEVSRAVLVLWLPQTGKQYSISGFMYAL